jgi:Double sensory domain of two-component sensor kinase
MSGAVVPVGTPRIREDVPRRSGSSRWFWILASIALSAVGAAFFGLNDYSSGTEALVTTARRNSQRFEAVYTDAADNRISALRLGVDLIVNNPEITGAFARDDRPALMGVAIPLFTGILQPRYGTDQFNFWTPPAKLYLRSNDPKEFGTDGTTARRSVASAIERRAPVTGMETGLGGRIAVRAMAPIFDGTRLVGIVELGDDLIAILRRARASTGVEFAAGLDRKRSDEVERIPDKNTDSIQGSDVFFDYSSEETARLIKTLAFNPRNPAGELIQAGGRSVLVRPFVIANFSGAPTVVIATIFDLTRQFDDAQAAAVIKAALLFSVLSLSTVVGFLQFQRLQHGFARIVFGERRKLQETSEALDIARERLKEVDLVKQGFFTNMVAAVSEPLQAVYGQLQIAIPAIDDALRSPGTSGQAEKMPKLLARLDFSLDEIGRLARLLADYRRVELSRQKLVRDSATMTSLADIVALTLDSELARFRRLPQLSMTAAIPVTLPPVRASAELLRNAVAGLAGYAAEVGGRGTIHIAGTVDEAGWVKLAITGSAFLAAGASGNSAEALLEDSRQFIARLASSAPPGANGTMMALVLARTIVENAGGRLDAAAGEDGHGFVMRLPAAI